MGQIFRFYFSAALVTFLHVVSVQASPSQEPPETVIDKPTLLRLFLHVKEETTPNPTSATALKEISDSYQSFDATIDLAPLDQERAKNWLVHILALKTGDAEAFMGDHWPFCPWTTEQIIAILHDPQYTNALRLRHTSALSRERQVFLQKLDLHLLPSVPKTFMTHDLATDLNASQNGLTFLPNMRSWKLITTLDVSRNALTTIENLTILHDLKSLLIHLNPITSLRSLENLTKIETLCLNNTLITSIAPLKSLPKLTSLFYSGISRGVDWESLIQLTQLKVLGCETNGIADAELFQPFTTLETLYLQRNQLTSILPLQPLKNLKELGLEGNPLASEPKSLEALKQFVAQPASAPTPERSTFSVEPSPPPRTFLNKLFK